MDTLVLACLLAVAGLICLVLGTGVLDTVGVVLLVLAAVAILVAVLGRGRTRL